MRGDEYAAYTKDETSEAVAALFEQKHGYTPAQVEDGGAVWLVGPLGDNGHSTKLPTPAQNAVGTPQARQGLHGELLRGTQMSLLARVEAERVEVTPERARQMVMEWEVTQ